VAYWRNVPAKLWNYKLAGYQVMKNWLSYRAKGQLGRSHEETRPGNPVHFFARTTLWHCTQLVVSWL
jgi:hypothetical protein